MPLDLDSVDEVWLGLTQAADYFQQGQHTPNTDSTGCRECKTYGYVERAKEAYLKRIKSDE